MSIKAGIPEATDILHMFAFCLSRVSHSMLALLKLQIYCTCLCFSTFYTKGSNICEFIFASLNNVVLLLGQLFKERVCSYANKHFKTTILLVANNENGIVASPKNVPLHLQAGFLTKWLFWYRYVLWHSCFTCFTISLFYL